MRTGECDVRLFELDGVIGSHCGHWRDILIPGVNMIGLNHIYIQSGYKMHYNAWCKVVEK